MEKEIVKRLTPTKDTLNLLFSLCGNVCAFPSCNHPVFDNENNFIAQVCHIESAKEGGERFNPESNNEERRQYKNLLIMCYEHHKVTDNVNVYTKEKLWELKSDHEGRFRIAPTYASIDQIDEIYHQESLKSLQKISNDTKVIISTQEVQTNLLKEILANQTKGKLSETVIFKTDFDKQIDTIIILRSKNQHNSAIALFENMKSDDWDLLSDREKFRVQANLGILYLDLMENEKAAEYFINALSYQPEDPKAINWGILGYTIICNDVEAELLIEKGLKIDPLNIGIYSSLVRLKKDLPLSDLFELIPDELRQNGEIAYEISRNCLKKRNYDDAITWAQIALDGLEESKYELRAVLATTILESIQQPYQVTTGQVSNETKSKAQYIIDLYSLAWDEVKHSDLRISRTWFLVNRAVARKYLGDYKGSYSDINEALKHKRDSFILRHLAIVSMEIGNEVEALKVVQEIKAEAIGADAREIDIFEAQLHWQMGETEKSISLMEILLQQELSESQRFYIVQYLSQQYLDKSNIAKARGFNDIAASLDSMALSPKIQNGKIILKDGQKELAIVLFQKVLSEIDENTKELEIYELAIQFEDLSMFDESIFLFEKITDLDNYSSHTKKLLNLYYSSGANAKLLSASERLILLFGPIPYVTELKSYVYEKINDFGKAIDTCIDHLNIYPEDQYVQIRLALIYSRKEDWENVRKIIGKIDHLDRTLAMVLQFKFAALCHNAGEVDKFRQFAYETRRQFQDKASAHEYFINLGIMSGDEDHPADPTEISIDCALTVAHENTTIGYLIEDRNDLSRLKGEISPKSSEAIALLGKKINDVVVLGQHNQEYTITTITHKYNAAMRESFQLIGSTFATQTSFRTLKIGESGNFEEDFKSLFENLNAASAHDEQIDELYKQNIIPLSTIASVKKNNLIKIWGGYVSDESLGVITTTIKEEVISSFGHFDNKRPIIFDLISLLTIAQLDFFDAIELLECEMYIAESTLLEINELIRELKVSSKTGTMSLGKKKGRYTRHVSSPLDIQKQVSHLKSLVDWIRGNCKSLPCTASLKLNGNEKSKLDDALGESTIDTILTAQENGYLIYAEEAIVRMLAFDENKVSGTATFMVLLYLQIRQKIPKEKFAAMSVDLMGLNYKWIPVDSSILLEAAKRTKYEYEYPLTYVTKGLNSNLVDDDYVMKVVCDYFVNLYKQPITFIFQRNVEDLRQNLVVNTLNVLSEKYDLKQSEASMLHLLSSRLGVSDNDYLTISKIISRFCSID